MKNLKIKEFIQENNSLFCYTPEKEKENISLHFLIETILNYVNEKPVKKLFELLKINKVADIFYKQTSRQRINYHKQTINFFD